MSERRPGVTGATADGLIACLLIGLGAVAYSNSFSGAFVFDDLPRIVDNGQIRQLWPPWLAMADRTRPVLQLSLALSYALDGLNPWGYHAFNLAVHIVAGLLLYGIVRRMLDSDGLRARYGEAARWLAAAVAAIWLVHPLQTESVTYIIQRTESLMGMFYLLTLYCGIRACQSPHPRRWGVAAVVACAFGMGSKEVMVSAPLLMLLYDRMFVAGSFTAALRRRWGLYAGLAATWPILVASLLNASAHEPLVPKLTPLSYALTQFEVILHYLRLSVWPSPLIFDYLWPTAESWSAVAPAAAVVLALLAGTVFALYRRWWVGFWGAWFFLILAPTSSVLPIADAAVEHRMYLSLAAVVVLVVVGGYALLERVGRKVGVSATPRMWVEAGLVVVVVAVLGQLTLRRNDDYRSEVALWSDSLAKRPGHYRAHLGLGLAAFRQGKIAEAIAHYKEALRLEPDYVEARNNLGEALASQGRFAEAIAEFREAIRLNPDYAQARNNLGAAFAGQGKIDEAITQYREALLLNRNYPQAHYNLGIDLFSQGKVAEAIAEYQEALRLKPDYPSARNNLGNALATEGRLAEAIAQYTAALRLQPGNAQAHNNLGFVLAREGRLLEAIAHYRDALRLQPDFAEAHDNLGNALLSQGNAAEAAGEFAAAVRLEPGPTDAHGNLHAAEAARAANAR
jgi:tetratricopeptide (TPR) repeat protein